MDGAPATLNLRNVPYFLLRALNQVDTAQHCASPATTHGQWATAETTYHKVQARDDSVQQYIIHKVPRALPSPHIQGRARSTTQLRLEVNWRPKLVRSPFIRHSVFYYSHRVSPATCLKSFRPLLLSFTPVPAISGSNSLL